MIELCGVGGYSEVGRNMTAVKINNDAVIFDMGFYMQKIADFEEQGYSRHFMNAEQMIKQDAIPNDNVIKGWWPNVRAIALSHAHLDHIAASMYLAQKYNASIYGTPYTLEVLRAMLKDDNMKVNNPMQSVRVNNVVEINDDLKLEFIGASHSVPQASMVALHTKKGVILYTNDFKFDQHPVVGEKPQYDRLKQLAKENVIALVLDALYARKPTKTPSESVAREMLREILLETDNKGKAIVGTCFASNIARLKSFVDFGRKLNRKVVFMGRSLRRYVTASDSLGISDFSDSVHIAGFRGQVRAKLSKMKKDGLDKYLIVVTGGQAEKSSVLNAMLHKELPFEFGEGDHFIFSNSVIPVEPNITNRKSMEDTLKRKRARLFTGVHVSGHGALEDMRDLINLVKPKHIIPSHGHRTLVENVNELGKEMGYKPGKDVHILRNGEKIKLD